MKILLTFLYAALLYSATATAVSRENEAHCFREKIPVLWQSCQASDQCIAVKTICTSIAINKKYKQELEKWYVACSSVACRKTTYFDVAICKSEKCQRK